MVGGGLLYVARKLQLQDPQTPAFLKNLPKNWETAATSVGWALTGLQLSQKVVGFLFRRRSVQQRVAALDKHWTFLKVGH